MAIEEKRGCGYRKAGALYLVGGALAIGCDRLPLRLEACPVCGAGIHFTRSMTEILPLDLFGPHIDPDAVRFAGEMRHAQFMGDIESELPEEAFTPQDICKDPVRPCEVCDPTNDFAYIMMVGEKYYPTPAHFMEEARRLGVSKRISGNSIPRHLELGKTVIYLAHPKACKIPVPTDDPDTPQGRLLDAQKNGFALGIFMAFRPQAIETPVYKKDLTKKKRAELKKRGITPIEVPDGDKDHE